MRKIVMSVSNEDSDRADHVGAQPSASTADAGASQVPQHQDETASAFLIPLQLSDQERRVWAGAETLVRQGLRPTVERLRDHLGGGSPNRLLLIQKQWFASVGPRLKSGLPASASAPKAQVQEQGAAVSEREKPDSLERKHLEVVEAMALAGELPSAKTLSNKLNGGSLTYTNRLIDMWFASLGSRLVGPPPDVLAEQLLNLSRQREPQPPRSKRAPLRESEFWDAADQLLVGGQWPTIDRLRKALGGGSPNTMGPRLDRWVAALGTRLAGMPPPTPSESTDALPDRGAEAQPRDAVSRLGPRGVQMEDVCRAADGWIAQGVQPTIARVRETLGSGSPNNIGPKLNHWFASLGSRLITKGQKKHDECMPAGEMEAAARHLEAVGVNSALLDEPRHESEVRDKPSPLQEYQRVKLHLERADFEHARGGLENALASAHLALAALRGQLEEAVRLRHASKREVEQLDLRLAEAETVQRVLSHSLEQTRADAQSANSEAQTRFSEREHSLLREVERERSAAQSALADLLKAQRERIDLEETFAVALDAERTALSKSRAAEAGLLRELESANARHTAALGASELRAAERERISNELIQSLQRRLAPDSKGD
jgi:hypothetical protein